MLEEHWKIKLKLHFEYLFLWDEVICLASCPHQNRKLKSRDAMAKQSRKFYLLHSKGGMARVRVDKGSRLLGASLFIMS